jgi:hypothetical protein
MCVIQTLVVYQAHDGPEHHSIPAEPWYAVSVLVTLLRHYACTCPRKC